MGNETNVALYLFKRLRQLGIESVHGVPGDFNLVALDLLPDADLKWVGNTNELNAAYAADGYARIKGLGALITTFGVGELSALAGVAGAFSERVPIVHIVGVPSTSSQKSGLLLHHTLGDGNFESFLHMSRNISQTVAILNDPATAAAEIDRALKACWTTARPVYIALPTDMVLKPITVSPSHNLDKPIDLSLSPNENEVEDDVIDRISELIYSSKSAVILADACCVRHRVVEETHELIEKTQLPAFVTPMAKGAINETLPQFGGVYVGSVSRPEVKEAVERADLLLSVGALKSDFNTGSFTYHTTALRTVEFHSDHIKIGYSVYPEVKMKFVLRRLLDTLDFSRINHVGRQPKLENVVPTGSDSGPAFSGESREPKEGEITHAWFWPRLGQWLREKDVVVTETGTANFGILETKFPKGVTGISQVLWGSIGYSVGCLQGAALAARETDPSRRVILIVGDGSLQLTVTEISTIIRRGLTPIIFVINNGGYTIERLIHGAEAEYNDIQGWKHTGILEVFGAKEGEYKNYVVKSRDDVDKLFGDEEFSNAGKIQLVELFMPKMDAPRSLNVTAELTAKRNAEA